MMRTIIVLTLLFSLTLFGDVISTNTVPELNSNSGSHGLATAAERSQDGQQGACQIERIAGGGSNYSVHTANGSSINANLRRTRDRRHRVSSNDPAGGRQNRAQSSQPYRLCGGGSSAPDRYQTDLAWNNEMASLVNEHRLANGLGTLVHVTSGSMFNGTNVRANELIQLFSHTRPNGSDCWTAYWESGFQYQGAIAGENIAKVYHYSGGLAATVRGFNLLKASTPHNNNMLNPNVTHMSFGLIYDTETKYIYIVQFFAKPAAGYTDPLQIAVFRTGYQNTYTLGDLIALAARGEGGVTPYNYQFYAVPSNGPSMILRDYASSNIYSWEPQTADTYSVGVNVRDASGATANQSNTIEVQPNVTDPLSLAVFRTGYQTSYTVGDSVGLAARAEGGTTPYRYQFYVVRSNGSQVILRDYAASNIFTWVPATPDTYQVGVNVMDAQNNLVNQVKTVTVHPATTEPLSVAVFRAGWKSEYVTGESVALAARGEGGSGDLQYKFYVYRSNGAMVVLKNYSSTNYFTWVPQTPDTYSVCVDIMDSSGTVVTASLSVTVN